MKWYTSAVEFVAFKNFSKEHGKNMRKRLYSVYYWKCDPLPSSVSLGSWLEMQCLAPLQLNQSEF